MPGQVEALAIELAGRSCYSRVMLRPGAPPRPCPTGTGTIPVFPVTPDMLTALAQAIAGGVTRHSDS